MANFWEDVESPLERDARIAMDPTNSGDDSIAVCVRQALSGEVLHHIRCRCRHDLVTVLVVRLDDVWPGEIRLVLPSGKLWTDPPLPAELAQLSADNMECTVQLVRAHITRSIASPPALRLAIEERLKGITPNFYNSDWCRDLGQPTGVIFEPLREGLPYIGYKGIARALMLRRRMDELLPTHDYNAAVVLETVLRDDTLWLHLHTNVHRDNAMCLLRTLDGKGAIDLGDQAWRFVGMGRRSGEEPP